MDKIRTSEAVPNPLDPADTNLHLGGSLRNLHENVQKSNAREYNSGDSKVNSLPYLSCEFDLTMTNRNYFNSLPREDLSSKDKILPETVSLSHSMPPRRSFGRIGLDFKKKDDHGFYKEIDTPALDPKEDFCSKLLTSPVVDHTTLGQVHLEAFRPLESKSHMTSTGQT
jgi:hypothetical protein